METTQRSPLEVCILIHYFTMAGDYQNVSNSLQNKLCEMFVEKGLLLRSEKMGQQYEGNREALTSYVDAICSVPLPRQVWAAVVPTITS